jgi:hypothetical protein
LPLIEWYNKTTKAEHGTKTQTEGERSMNFYNLIESGYVIRVSDEKNKLDPAEFWMKDGQVLVWAPEIGIANPPFTQDKLNAHFSTMLEEGLIITVKHKNNFKK